MGLGFQKLGITMWGSMAAGGRIAESLHVETTAMRQKELAGNSVDF